MTIRINILRLGVASAVVGIAAFGNVAAIAAGTCSAVSAMRVTPLVELYTSEGCDSCPPADRWLSSNFPAATEGAAVSVLAFHVDYWDRLGWKDRFASPAFTQRQYAAVAAATTGGGNAFAYTPQVLVQGKDTQNWRGGGAKAAMSAAQTQTARASIGLELTTGTTGVEVIAKVGVPDLAVRRNAVLWLAYADSDLGTDVAAGENRGVHLKHDHVARALAGPFAASDAPEVTVRATLARPREQGKAPAVVAIVQDQRSGAVLQTLTLPLCPAT